MKYSGPTADTGARRSEKKQVVLRIKDAVWAVADYPSASIWAAPQGYRFSPRALVAALNIPHVIASESKQSRATPVDIG